VPVSALERLDLPIPVASLVAQDRGQIPVGQGESRVDRDGLLEQRNGRIEVPFPVPGVLRLRVLAQRLQRAGRDVSERRTGAHRGIRLADPLTELG